MTDATWEDLEPKLREYLDRLCGRPDLVYRALALLARNPNANPYRVAYAVARPYREPLPELTPDEIKAAEREAEAAHISLAAAIRRVKRRKMVAIA